MIQQLQAVLRKEMPYGFKQKINLRKNEKITGMCIKNGEMQLQSWFL